MYWQNETGRYHVGSCSNGKVNEEGYVDCIGEAIEHCEYWLADRIIDCYWIADLTKEPGKGIVWKRGI